MAIAEGIPWLGLTTCLCRTKNNSVSAKKFHYTIQKLPPSFDLKKNMQYAFWENSLLYRLEMFNRPLRKLEI
jgi:hypothetical protein